MVYIPTPLKNPPPPQRLGPSLGLRQPRSVVPSQPGVKRSAATFTHPGYHTVQQQEVVPGVNLVEQLALEQQAGNLMSSLASLAANLSAGAKHLADLGEGGSGKKRKKKGEGLDDMVEEEELVPEVFEGIHGKDNGVDEICWEVRSKLRPFTGDWAEFWKHQPRVCHPVRESLDTGFLRMDPVSGVVTMRDHDRGAPRKIKQYLKDNIRVTKSRAWVSTEGDDLHDIGLSKNYQEPTGVYEVMSAIHQYASNVWMIRRDDASGLLMLRVLHDVKFFAPLLISKIKTKAERDKKQLEVISWFADHVLELNSQRGRLAKPPLEYDEVRRVATSAANKIYSGSGVSLGWEMDMGACSFDPYTTADEQRQDWQGGRGGGGARAGWRGGRGGRGGGRGTVFAGPGAQYGGGQVGANVGGQQVVGGQGASGGVVRDRYSNLRSTFLLITNLLGNFLDLLIPLSVKGLATIITVAHATTRIASSCTDATRCIRLI